MFVLVKCRGAGANRHAEAMCWGGARGLEAGLALLAAWGDDRFSELSANLSRRRGIKAEVYQKLPGSRGKCPRLPQGCGGKPNGGTYRYLASMSNLEALYVSNSKVD